MKPDVVHVAITKSDGSLSIMQFVTNDQVRVREASRDNIEASIKKAGIEAVSWRIIKPEDIPADRSRRNFWRDTGTEIVVAPE